MCLEGVSTTRRNETHERGGRGWGNVCTRQEADSHRPRWVRRTTDQDPGRRGSSSGGHLLRDPPSGLWLLPQARGMCLFSELGRDERAPTWAPRGRVGRAGSTLRDVPLTQPRLPAWGGSSPPGGPGPSAEPAGSRASSAALRWQRKPQEVAEAAGPSLARA